MKTQDVILHCGGWTASREDVGAVELPEATETYHPLPHLDLVEQIRERLPRFGMKVVNEKFGLARGGNQLFGILNCTNGVNAKDWRLAIGLRNSYDKSLIVSTVAGADVNVCDNLLFSGEVRMDRMHTKHLMRDLPYLLDTMILKLRPMIQRVKAEVNALKGVDMTDRDAHHLMIESMEQGIVPATRLPVIAGHWREPKHEEFKPRTAWSLMNAFTEVEKDRASTVFNRTIDLNALFRERLGIEV
jgi:hypothetical protein